MRRHAPGHDRRMRQCAVSELHPPRAPGRGGVIGFADHEGRQEGHRHPQRCPDRRADGHQPILRPRRDVRELGLPPPQPCHPPALHRRDEARRGGHRAHPLPRGNPEHAAAGEDQHRRERPGAAPPRSRPGDGRGRAPQRRHREVPRARRQQQPPSAGRDPGRRGRAHRLDRSAARAHRAGRRAELPRAADPQVRMKRAAFALLTLLAASPLFAWGEKGHYLVNEAATMSLPTDMPTFFYKAFPQLVWTAFDPDRWRSAGVSLEAANPPDHFLDYEYVNGLQLPPDRYKFIALLGSSGTLRRHGLENSWTGFLPWRIAELSDLLTNEWRQWRFSAPG